MRTAITLLLISAASAAYPLSKSDVVVFSDREEKNTSRTEIRVEIDGDTVTAAYTIPDHPELGYAYAGVSIKVESIPAYSLSFQMKRSPDAAQPTRLSLNAASKKRGKIDFAKIGTVTTEWQTFSVSVEDVGFAGGISDIESAAVSLGANTMKDAITTATGTIWIRAMRVSSERVRSRTAVPEYGFLKEKKVRSFKRGHAGWIYEESEDHVARIASWNKEHAVPIRMLFVYAGSFTFTPDHGTLSALKTSRLAWFREHLPADVEVHANFDASDGKLLGTFPAAKQEALARSAADAVNADPSCAGIHFDIEPYVSDALPFYIAVKKYSTKPVSAAVADWDRHLIAVLDYAVLMAYDIAKTPEQFKPAALSRYRAFAADADAAGTQYFLGVPFVSTAVEYEYRENMKSGAKEQSGYTMEAFTLAARDAFSELDKKGDALYGGAAIWGFLSGGNARKDWVHQPRDLTAPCWKYLSDF